MFGESGNLSTFRRTEELLIPAVHQQPDLIADDNSGFINQRALLASVLKDRASTELRDCCARAFALHVEYGFPDLGQSFAEACRMRFLVAEEHAVPSLYEVRSLLARF
jgi:hypothetical protein